jgi:hypothetical protein
MWRLQLVRHGLPLAAAMGRRSAPVAWGYVWPTVTTACVPHARTHGVLAPSITYGAGLGSLCPPGLQCGAVLVLIPPRHVVWCASSSATVCRTEDGEGGREQSQSTCTRIPLGDPTGHCLLCQPTCRNPILGGGAVWPQPPVGLMGNHGGTLRNGSARPPHPQQGTCC